MSDEIFSLRSQLMSQKEKVEASWVRKKEEFIQSPKFVELYSEKAKDFFKLGFKACVQQLQDNRFFEAEYAYPFSNSIKALDDLFEEGQAAEEAKE